MNFVKSVAIAAVLCAVSSSAWAAEYWGAFLSVQGPKDHFAISWNYPDRDTALTAAIQQCEKRMRRRCWPRHKDIHHFWTPDHGLLFSTSAKPETDNLPTDAKNKIAISQIRCVLVTWKRGVGYSALRGYSEQELITKLERREQSDKAYYQDSNRRYNTFEGTYCNTR